ncbi:MAG: periplasmic heavy metal sensor [Pseudomonadota bacterium]
MTGGEDISADGSADEGAPPPDPAPRRRRRWTAWLLGASLCLNLLLIGAAVGAAMGRWGPHSSELPAGFDRRALWSAYKSLPDAEQDRIEAILRRLRPELKVIARDRMASRVRMAQALEAEILDPEALREAMAAARLRSRAGRDVIDGAFAQFAAGLDAATRREIAQALRRPPHRFGRDAD